MRSKSALAGLIMAGGLAALGSSVISAPEPCPTEPPPGPLEGGIAVQGLIARRVDAQAGFIAGNDPISHLAVQTPICRGALVDGRHGLTDIRPGDDIMVREVKNRSGRFVAIEVEVNVMTLDARIVSRKADALRFITLDYHTGKPTNTRWTSGTAPRRILVDHATRVAYRGASYNSAFLRRGDDVKVYGHKPPASDTVSAYLIEIFRRPVL